jgi:hypothetical protein
MDVDFCLEAVEEALARYGRPQIFNTDQGSQFTSAAAGGSHGGLFCVGTGVGVEVGTGVGAGLGIGVGTGVGMGSRSQLSCYR